MAKFGVHSEVGKLRTVMVCRPGLATSRLKGGPAPHLGMVDLIAFLFAVFTLYVCGPELVLCGLLLLIFGIPVYVFQQGRNSGLQFI